LSAGGRVGLAAAGTVVATFKATEFGAAVGFALDDERRLKRKRCCCDDDFFFFGATVLSGQPERDRLVSPPAFQQELVLAEAELKR
jgi:hypothetical protein